MAAKHPKLPNNFQNEAEPLENAAKSARPAPQNGPDDSGVHPQPGSADELTAGTLKAPKKRGPKTSRGKRAVSRNAVKHAILSENPVAIAGFETVEEWEEFEREIVEAWAPVGRYERELARDIAFGLWRLRRCRINESAVLGQQLEEAIDQLMIPDDDDDDDEDEDGDEGGPVHNQPEPEPRVLDPVTIRAHQQLHIIPNGWNIDRILRYDTHARRCLLQTVHELEVRQARRQGEQPPVPARVDFTAGPSLRKPTVAGSSGLQQLNQDLEVTRRAFAENRRRARRSADG